MTDTTDHQYDEARNVEALGRLPARLQVVFALLCAFRLLPAYRRFHARTGRGDPRALVEMVEALWADCVARTMGEDQAAERAEKCLQLIPSEDEGWDEETQPYAEDAAAAVAYAYRSRLTASPQEAAWAGRRLFEAVDHHVHRITKPATGAPEAEAESRSHPLIRAEVERQERDLYDLEGLARLEALARPLEELRERSEVEAESIFEPPAEETHQYQ